MKLSEKITEKRLELEKTQREFGELFGVGWKAVSDWEAGRRSPNGENRVKFCKLFGMNFFD